MFENWPQLATLALMLIALISGAYRHGKPQDKDNFWTTFVAVAINLTLLYFGGFFQMFGWYWH
jgi:hypothetical protein